jgi:sporulation protein YtfJ
MMEHPIQGLMKTAMENIKEMVDVNTIVGDPVETPDGSVIIPVSRVGFGFAAGGTQFAPDRHEPNSKTTSQIALDPFPFGGGSGGGISINPIAFVIVGREGVRVVPLDQSTHLYDRLIEFAPSVIEKIQSMVQHRNTAPAPSTPPAPEQKGTQQPHYA